MKTSFIAPGFATFDRAFWFLYKEGAELRAISMQGEERVLTGDEDVTPGWVGDGADDAFRALRGAALKKKAAEGT